MGKVSEPEGSDLDLSIWFWLKRDYCLENLDEELRISPPQVIFFIILMRKKTITMGLWYTLEHFDRKGKQKKEEMKRTVNLP